MNNIPGFFGRFWWVATVGGVLLLGLVPGAAGPAGDDPALDKWLKPHDWRRDLFEALKKRQQADGSWTNAGDRAYCESTPELATAFALMALSYCGPAK